MASSPSRNLLLDSSCSGSTCEKLQEKICSSADQKCVLHSTVPCYSRHVEHLPFASFSLLVSTFFRSLQFLIRMHVNANPAFGHVQKIATNQHLNGRELAVASKSFKVCNQERREERLEIVKAGRRRSRADKKISDCTPNPNPDKRRTCTGGGTLLTQKPQTGETPPAQNLKGLHHAMLGVRVQTRARGELKKGKANPSITNQWV